VHPSSLRASFDVRTVEGMTRDEVHGALRAALERAGLAERVDIVALDPPADWFPPGPAVTSGRLHAAAREALRLAVAADPPERILGGTTDSSYLTGRGVAALPALGPGTLGVAHRPNESIEVGALEQGIDVLEALVTAYCRSE
jgi:acetylornithine deacetylase/succinyl-diaminopimelate desuccinylase-like protein